MQEIRLTDGQRLAAINALHDAEEAGRSLSARVDSVVAAVQGQAPPLPDADELASTLESVVRVLERRLATEAPDDQLTADQATLHTARAMLGLAAAGG